MLADIFEEAGTMTVSFKYSDFWTGETTGNIMISSDSKAQEAAFTGDLYVVGEAIDFELYINTERMAFGSRRLDNNYYGFNYETFRNDFRAFGSDMGLDRYTINEISDIVDIIADIIKESMDMDALEDFFDDDELKFLMEFINACEVTSERTQIQSGNSEVSCTRIDYLIAKDALLILLNGFYDILQNNDAIRSQFSIFDNQMFSAGVFGYNPYDEMTREFRNMIREFERNYSGTITISFFISSNRLLCMEINADMMFDGERGIIAAKLDFGSSIEDRWVFDIEVSSEYDDNSVRVAWDYRKRSGGDEIENSIFITTDSGYGLDTEMIILSSVWSPTRGNFTLAYDDGWNSGEITGNFTVSGRGFRFSFDNPFPSYNAAELTFEIAAEPGAQIKQIDYININRWSDTLVPAIEDLFYYWLW
jgi:hypothetical protein